MSGHQNIVLKSCFGPVTALVTVAILVLLVMLTGGRAIAQTADGAANSSAIRYVIYYNSDASPPTSLLGTPYTHVILSFITLPSDLPADAPVTLVVPAKLSPALDVIGRLQAEGKKVLISFGGGDLQLAEYAGVTNRVAELAKVISAFVARHGFDGVDIDFEVSQALRLAPSSEVFDGRRFLIDFTKALDAALPDEVLLTHVPQAPYLDPAWQGGPYLDVLREAGDMIDWITVQYYNNPNFDAPVASRIVGRAKNPLPWSYSGIVSGAGGFFWPPEKTLIGLPVYRDDASNGHLPPHVVASDVVCPLLERFGGAFGGITGWQFSTLTRNHRFWNHQMKGALTGASCQY